MPRYIDADALRDKLGRAFIDMDDFHFECPAEVNGMLDYAIDCVKEQPTADVVEVKRGKWIEDGYQGYPCVCSVCGIRQEVKAKFLFSFCPNCGAEMRERMVSE